MSKFSANFSIISFHKILVSWILDMTNGLISMRPRHSSPKMSLGHKNFVGKKNRHGVKLGFAHLEVLVVFNSHWQICKIVLQSRHFRSIHAVFLSRKFLAKLIFLTYCKRIIHAISTKKNSWKPSRDGLFWRHFLLKTTFYLLKKSV